MNDKIPVQCKCGGRSGALVKCVLHTLRSIGYDGESEEVEVTTSGRYHNARCADCGKPMRFKHAAPEER
jgi:hypothetical protein